MDNYLKDPIVNSTAEYVFERKGGKHTVITNETMGLGFETIEKYTGTLCADTDEFASKMAMSLPLALIIFSMY